MPNADRTLCIVQMLPALHGGGVERGTVEIANALVAAGHRSIVISAGGPLLAEMPGTEHVALPVGRKSPLSLAWVPVLRRYLRRTRPDVLHVRSRWPAWIGYLAWQGLTRPARPRFVTTVHGLYSVSRYSAIMARGEAVIAVSEAVRRYLLIHYPRSVDPSRIHLIHRGVDTAVYRRGFRPDSQWLDEWHRRRPYLEGRRIVTLPARLTRLKGHLDFVRLVAGLRARGIDAHGLVVGGEDPRRRRYAAEVRREVEARGLTHRIDFLGHRPDLREILAVSDLSVSLSSTPESFGRTVLEALSLGCPVVGYAHGGVVEILEAMYPAGAVAPGDLDAALDAAARSLTAPGPIASAPQFDLSRMLDRTLALYRRLAAGATA